MGQQNLPRWKIVTGYSLFGLLFFVLFVFLTFPYDTLEQRLKAEAAAQGYVLTVGSIGPGFLGVTAKNLLVSKPAEPGAATAPGELPIDKVTVRPGLFPPGVAFSASLLGGSVSGNFSDIGIGDVSLDVHADDVMLGDPRLKAMTGMDLEGSADLELSLEMPRGSGGSGSATTGSASKSSAKGADLAQADGRLKLDLSQAKVNGGTVTLSLPAFGNQPTPIDLPRIAFGDLSANVKFEKGQGTVEALRGKSEDLEIVGTGTIKLARNYLYSETDLDLKLKAEDDFRKRLGLMGSALSMLPADPQNPAFRVAKIGGYLGQPKLRKR